MSTLLVVALFGYCSTVIDKQTVCTPVQAIHERESLLERCSPWAKSLGGKGWAYVNARSHEELDEKQRGRCARFEEIDRGDSYACRVKRVCAGTEKLLDTSVTLKALTAEAALDRCVNLAADAYLAALKSAASEGCLIAPVINSL